MKASFSTMPIIPREPKIPKSKVKKIPIKEIKTGIPTPKDFDNFIPWVCRHFQVPTDVIIQRKTEEQYNRMDSKRLSMPRIKSDAKYKLESVVKTNSTSRTTSTDKTSSNAIHLITYYNTKGYLIEIEFINCPFKIHKKVIMAINVCLPFHPKLHRITVKGATHIECGLYEISKLLPYSNITDIYLDGSPVKEGNFDVLLEKESQLQNLSLCRCNINDEICIKIVNKLDYEAPASKSLLTLDLSSNQIDDEGVTALGKILRTNRMLLHLNLADNKITDAGAFHIFNSLLLFRLNDHEVLERNKSYLKYCFNRLIVLKQCEKELKSRLKAEDKDNRKYRRRRTEILKLDEKYDLIKKSEQRNNYDNVKRKHTLHKHKQSLFNKDLSMMNTAETMAKEIIGEFSHVFHDLNITHKRGRLYAIGNFNLCSLNLAYNNLTYLSVKKVYDVLKYQKELLYKPPKCKGLLRVVLNGNIIPEHCDELKAIESYLRIAISENVENISEISSNFKSPSRRSRNAKMHLIVQGV